ncbi:general odorant-binding protein 19a [Drosophila innubila]|uniref:general odorant-binding protein 19a n=1 Tax=Drosophila innubila TaxID=198719 RepID=UPI00148CB3C2|nr:general odorant-binding protein 19a [Drosophila innubila]
MRYDLLICNLLLLGLPLCWAGATEEQMWAAGKLMRDVCLPKFSKVSVEVADSIHNGNIPDDKDSKCYINCILEMMQTIKKGKFQLESALKQVELLLPDKYKPSYLKGLDQCKDATSGIKNNCDAGHALLTCLRSKINVFIFP